MNRRKFSLTATAATAVTIAFPVERNQGYVLKSWPDAPANRGVLFHLNTQIHKDARVILKPQKREN